MSLSLCQTHKILNDILSYQITPYSINNSLNQKFTSSQHITFNNKNSNIHTIVKIKLAALNTKNHQQTFNQTFPQLTFNFQPSTEYIFPQEPTRYSTSPGKFVANHGGRMHFPFLSFKLSKFDGLIIVSSDHFGRFREISMAKQENGNFDVRFKYYDLCLQPNQNYDFDDAYLVLFKIKKSFLNDSLKVYKQISSQWIKNSHKMQKLIANPFHSSFLLRVIQFYQLQWHHSHKRVQNVSKLYILQLIKQDEQLIGPIKCIHLRDWSAEGKDLSCKFGNYFKETMVGQEISKEWLKQQITKLKKLGFEVGLYFEGYLVSKKLFSQNDQQNQKMQSMQMLDSEGKPYNFWGSKNYVMCSSDHHWRNLISQTVAKVVDYLKVDAVYIDEFGFGSRTSHYKKCTNDKHSHSLENFDLQIGQKETLKQIKSNLNQKKLNTQIYIEQTPFHSCFSQINGSLSTSAIKCAKQHPSSLIPIILTRFISPHHKTYQIITQYTMANEDILSNNKTIIQDLEQIKRAILISFWNGCGIYLPKNLRFYDKLVVEMIESCNRNFLRFVQFYVNGNATPLVIGDVGKGVEQVLGHKFWLGNQNDSGNGNQQEQAKQQNQQKNILNVLNLSQQIQQFTICKCLTNNQSEITNQCKCEMKQQFAMNPMSLGVYYQNDGYIQIACL